MTEIFIEPELENLAETHNAEEWFALCVELGLEQQAKMADRSPDLKAPPYMMLDPKTERIVKVLCPRGVEYNKYSASTIPTDILLEIKKCVENGWYSKIHIFYDDKTPDPFVIGEFKDPNSQWMTHKHLIARWGAELIPFEELEIKALQRLKGSIVPLLAEMENKMRYALENTDVFIQGLLNGKDAPKLTIDVPNLSSTWDLPF